LLGDRWESGVEIPILFILFNMKPMRLSSQYLSQLDEERLLSLSEKELHLLSIKLLNDLKEAREHLEQNSHNSSRLSSSEAPWDKAQDQSNDHDVSEEPRDSDNSKKEPRGWPTNLGTVLCGLSLVTGSVIAVLLWISDEAKSVLTAVTVLMIGTVWLLLLTFGFLLLVSRRFRGWFSAHKLSIQDVTAILLLIVTGILVWTTIQYTEFTREMKMFQQEEFIFSVLNNAGIEPLTLELECKCTPKERSMKNGEVIYQCEKFNLYVTNNTSVKLEDVWVVAKAISGTSASKSILLSEETKGKIVKASPYEWFFEHKLADINKSLAALGNISTLSVSVEYYTPTYTMFIQRQFFSFPTCAPVNTHIDEASKHSSLGNPKMFYK